MFTVYHGYLSLLREQQDKALLYLAYAQQNKIVVYLRVGVWLLCVWLELISPEGICVIAKIQKKRKKLETNKWVLKTKHIRRRQQWTTKNNDWLLRHNVIQRTHSHLHITILHCSTERVRRTTYVHKYDMQKHKITVIHTKKMPVLL